MEQNLDEKLSRVESTIGIMKTNLRLPENEVIEKLAEATNLHSLANIYIQEDEPENKDGIWIQANPETVPYDTVKIDEQVKLSGRWRPDLKMDLKKAYGSMPLVACCVDNVLYYIASSTIFSCDIKTGTIATVASVQGSTLCTDGQYLYTCSQKIFTRVEIKSHTVRTYTLNPSDSTYFNMGYCWYNPHNKCVYVMSVNYSEGYKWDTTTQTLSSRLWYNDRRAVGLYIPYSSEECLWLSSSHTGYNSLRSCIYNETTQKMTTIETNLYDMLFNSLYSWVDMGEYFYVAAYNFTKVFKISKTTLEAEECTDIFADENLLNARQLLFINNGFYAITTETSGSSSPMCLVKMDMEPAINLYDHNSIIIMQSPITQSEKHTALWTYPSLEGRMCQSFWDVYYYNKDTGFNFALPTYYGDGEKWIKFKG